MRTTINLDEDAVLAAKSLAQRKRLSFGEAVALLVRRGASSGADAGRTAAALRGRFALLQVRDELVTPQHVRALMDREGI